MRWPAMLVVMVSLFSTLALASPRLVTVGEADAGTVIDLPGDAVAVITLAANPATGFSWQIESLPGHLQFLGREYHQPEDGLLGSWGTEKIYVAGAGKGAGPVSLVYQRPFGPELESGMSLNFSFSSQGKLGKSFSLPEPEDEYLPPMYTSSDLGLPEHFNWCEQGGCTPIRDQGYCGSCWAFATVGALESAIKINDGISADLSEQYLVSCNDDGWSCNGGWFAHEYHQWKMVSGETEAGAVMESGFPYTASDQSCNPPHQKAYQLEDWDYVSDSGSVPTVDQMKEAIYSHGPISVAVCANSSFQAYSGGIFSGPSCSGVNHAVTLTGWDDGQGVWYLRNSWGTGWGENGYMRIKYGVCKTGYAACYVSYAGTGAHAGFSYTAEELSASFSDTSTPSSGAALIDWAWDFGDGESSSEQNPMHTYAEEGTYTVTLIVQDDAGQSDDFSMDVTVPFVPEYCQSQSNTCSEEWMHQVDIGSFTNQSDAQKYSDFTNLTVSLETGQSYPVTITPQFNGGPWTEYFKIWIDFNRDGDFSDDGEQVFNSSGTSAVSGQIDIPAYTAEVTTRMRISMKYNDAPGPCETFSYGEVEDYTVEITSGGGSNQAPVAAAGDDQAVEEGAPVVLDGSFSYDPDGDAITYSWTQTSGPAVSLSDPYAPQPSFDAPQVAQDTSLTFSLVVSDGQLESSPDSVAVLVTDVNHAPVADAGPDREVEEGLPVSLDGSQSQDPDGDPITFSWSQTGGPAVALDDPHAAQPSFAAPMVSADTLLTFKLVVNDGALDSQPDYANVLVLNVNHPPSAHAGEDQAAGEGSLVILDGSLSSDPDGDVLSYSWTQIEGPPAPLSGPQTVSPGFGAPYVAGTVTMTFSLVVHDGEFESEPALVSVTVSDTPGWDLLPASGDTPITIPDYSNSGALSRLPVAQSGTLTAMQVVVNIAHPDIQELRVVLQCPSGTQVVLHNRTGWPDDGGLYKTYEVTECNGQDVQGDWQLKVSDHLAQVIGKLDSWSLRLEVGAAGGPTQQTSSDTPMGIPDSDSTGIQSIIPIQEQGTVSAVEVDVNIRHPYIGALQVKLQCPDGTTTTLHNRTGGSTNNIIKTYQVSACNGQPLAGDWKLLANDHDGYNDNGKLRNWTVRIWK